MASKEAKNVTFEPLDGFQHLRGHFGVVFRGQFNADIILGRFHTLLRLNDLLRDFFSQQLALSVSQSVCDQNPKTSIYQLF